MANSPVRGHIIYYIHRMKHTFYSILLVAVALVAITALPGCDSRSCRDVTCGLNQVCVQGNCLCADGLEGTDCSVQSFQKYLRNYQVFENCFGTPSPVGNYMSFITPGVRFNEVILNNFLGQGIQATAVIRTDQTNQGNLLQIPTQNWGSTSFSGQGFYNPATQRITFQMTYNFNFTSYQCEHIFYPQ